jgi:hypothetical protein
MNFVVALFQRFCMVFFVLFFSFKDLHGVVGWFFEWWEMDHHGGGVGG